MLRGILVKQNLTQTLYVKERESDSALASVGMEVGAGVLIPLYLCVAAGELHGTSGSTEHSLITLLEMTLFLGLLSKSNIMLSCELESVRPLCPWGSPGKDTRVGCCFLLHGIFLTQGSNLHLLCLLNWQAGSLPLATPRRLKHLMGAWWTAPRDGNILNV